MKRKFTISCPAFLKILLLKGDSTDLWACSRGVMVKAMDCGIVESKFVLQSRYYVHFRANALGKL